MVLKMKCSNKILILSSLVILILGMAAISATDVNADIASDINQNDESLMAVGDNDDYLADSDESNIIGDSQDEILGDDNNSVMSLSDLKKKISSSSSIVLDSDVTYDSSVDSIGGVVIGKDVTINGNGHTIDGKSKTRIFKVATGKTLTLTNINFVNGYMANDYGGVILNSGTIKISNCNFTGCKVVGSKASGGAISGSGSGTISKCIFDKCSATYYGGAVNSNKLVFKYCNFTNNVASNGGALGGTVYIYNCFFKNCKATATANSKNDDNGGGACNGAIPKVESSVFINCKAPKGYGGALRGETNAVDCEFTGCSAKEGGAIRGISTVTGCTFKNCVASSQMGGAVFTQQSTIKKCNFIGCSATKSNAGAVFVGGKVNVVSCKFINCSAPKASGGAVYGNGVINKCTFEGNSAKYGGAVSSYSVTVKSSTFTKNSATKGGAAYNIKSLTGSTFNNNKATYGGAVYNAQKVVSSKFNNNNAKFGALSYNDVNVVFTKINVKNSVKLVNGLFYNQKHKLTLTSSTIVNTAKFTKYFNYNTGTFIYNKNKLKSSVKVKAVAGPNKVRAK